MPSIGHIAVGIAAGRGAAPPAKLERWRWALWYVAVSCAADLDFLLVALGVPKDSLWGHRGVSHSLVLAGVAGAATAVLARRWGRRPLEGAILGFAVYASHMFFDCLNVGSLGVPWFWPLTSADFRLPWHPIPALQTASDFLTLGAVPVLLAEVVLFAPFWLYGVFGRRIGSKPPLAKPARVARPRARRPSRARG